MVLGIVAGRWQFERYEARADALRASEAAQGLPVVPWDEVVGDGETLGAAEWRVVTVRGRFDAASLTALRGRTVEREASLQYLAWLVTDTGAVLVNTGWVPRDSGEVISLPTGEVEITGIVRAQEADDGKRGDGATRITAQQLPAPSGPAYPGWLMVRDPCTAEGCLGTALQPVPAPQLSLGPHLSYAFQWWLLAAAAPVITVAVLRKDARHGRERDRLETDEQTPQAAPKRRTVPRQLSDEEIEDAL
jgi:cytochrome oxidase assembly protein ShyY1